MAITKPTSLPTWATSASVVEPSLGKKAAGWLSGERVAAGMLNWLQRNVSEWLQWLYVGSSRTLPWQHTTELPGAEGAHRAIAVLQSTTKVGAMVLLESVPGTWNLRVCNPITSAWEETGALGGSATPLMFNEGGLAANADRFVLVGKSGRIRTYESGAWTVRTPAASFSGDFRDVIWTGTQFVAIGGNYEVQTSPDGITWTRRASTAVAGGPAPMLDCASIACGGTRLVRGGKDTANRAALWYSDDGGTTWLWAYRSALVDSFTKVVGTAALDGTPIFAAQYQGAYSFVGSTGGIAWVEVPQLNPYFYTLECAYNDLLIGAGGLFISANGIDWKPLPFTATDGLIAKAAVSPQGWALLSRYNAGSHVAARTPIQRWF